MNYIKNLEIFKILSEKHKESCNNEEIFFDKNNKNILIPLMNNAELFKLVLEKELELDIDKNNILFTKQYGSNENILLQLINNEKLFPIVLEEELKFFNDNPKQIFINNKTKKIEPFVPCIYKLNINNIKLIVETAIKILNVEEFNTYTRNLLDLLRRQVGEEYVQNLQKQVQDKEQEQLTQQSTSLQQVENDLKEQEHNTKLVETPTIPD